MDSNADRQLENSQVAETEGSRRDVVRKLGKFAAYAAPFTVLAFTQKANAASGSGPRPLPHS
jgi:hypothetical protein